MDQVNGQKYVRSPTGNTFSLVGVDINPDGNGRHHLIFMTHQDHLSVLLAAFNGAGSCASASGDLALTPAGPGVAAAVAYCGVAGALLNFFNVG
jgi:hypothetical protein